MTIDHAGISQALRSFQMKVLDQTSLTAACEDIEWGTDGESAKVHGRLYCFDDDQLIQLATFRAYYWTQNDEWRIVTVDSHLATLLTAAMISSR